MTSTSVAPWLEGSHWPTVPIRLLARLGSGHTPSRSMPKYWENCTVPWITLADVWQLRSGTIDVIRETKEKVSTLGLANSAAVKHPAGTVILSRTASVGFSAIMGADMATSQDFATWTCGPKLDPKYLLHSLRAMAPDLKRIATGSTHKTIYMPDIEQLRVPVPPMDEQRRIAEYLDAETARIDTLTQIAQQGKKLLDERRWATVHAAVTGLGTSEGKKDLGLGWAKSLPERWPVVPLKWIATLGSGHTPSRTKPEYWENCSIPWISLFDVGRMRDARQEKLNETAQQISNLGMANSSACLHPAGTVVLSRTASVGFSTVMGLDMAVSQHFVTWTCSESLSPHYLLHTLRAMRQYFESVQVGTTNVTVFMPDLNAIKVPLPPLDEQEEIVQRIRAQTAQIDALAEKFDRQVNLLTERRQALITAAVTGLIDVSTASGRGIGE
ncbi:restriction endonuclease subunit S [Streptomyces sp. NPDC055092]